MKHLSRSVVLSLALCAVLAAPAAAAPSMAVTDADPSGGPRWGVRVTQETIRARTVRCLRAGQVTPAGLRRVFADGTRRQLTGNALKRCSPPRLREGALLVERMVDDPSKATPRLTRMVVAGLAGDRAQRATITWRGGRRVVRTGRLGAYLAVLPRGARQRDLTISVRHGDGEVTTVDYRRAKPRLRPRPGSVRVELETSDPVSGLRQGMLVWRIPGNGTCQYLGDLVDGEVGSYQPRLGAFSEYPVNDGGNCADAARFDRPVAPGVGTDGRTIRVTGLVRADVRSLEIAVGDGEPVEISRSGAYGLIVAATGPAGAFPPVRTRATLKDGTVVEDTFPGSGGPPPRPSG